jgi:hypothetical protein
LRDFFEPPSTSQSSRQVEFPEQYPATYDLNEAIVPDDGDSSDAQLVRPLLKNTQLESRPLQLVYDADRDGWNPSAFHQAVDGRGAAVILAKSEMGSIFGGYNPKGWACLGGARPSVAAFLFYQTKTCFQKLRKVGGGGLACARDDPNFGISLGPDGLVIGLQAGKPQLAQSKLGTYFERGPEEMPSLCGGATDLVQLKVLVGVYAPGKDIPYSGGVMDCPQPTSF